MSKTIELQKNTAKTAIRHIRGYHRSVENLIEIIKKKMSDSKDDKLMDTLTEINHHLDNLSMGIRLSENDFKDILGEEFKDENLLLTKLNNDIALLNKKITEVKKLGKKREQVDKERIDNLNEEIKNLRNNISSDINSLPITSSFFVPEPDILTFDTSYGLLDSDKPLLTKWDHIEPNFLGNPSLNHIQISGIEQKKEENQNNEKTAKTKKRKSKKK